MCHRRIVKHRRHFRPSRVLNQQIRWLHISVHRVCGKSALNSFPHPHPQYTIDHLPPQTTHTLRQQIQLLHHETLVLRPREIKRIWRKKIRHPAGLELGLVC